MGSIDWKTVKMVVFDVDGTLYDQDGLRKAMLKRLLLHYVFRPWLSHELNVLRVFRAEREAHAGLSFENLQKEQYEWCTKGLRISTDKVEKIVDHWMGEAPLNVIRAYRFDQIQAFFEALRAKGIKRAVYSDYPFKLKMEAMGLPYDLGIDSTEAHINALKPHPKGLEYLLEQTNMRPEQCVFIGDREERDGACAQAVGMPYLIIDPQNKNYFRNLIKEVSGSIN